MRTTVLLFGLLAGALIVALKLIEFQFLVVEHSLEIYGGLVAAIFAALGIWLGLRITGSKETLIVKEVLEKLDAKRRTQAVQIAKAAGLIA